MSRPSVATSRIKKISPEGIFDADDLLAAEEPLEIQLDFGLPNDRRQKSISVTMRTPGNDFELALGFLFTEGIITNPQDVLQIRYCTELNRIENKENVVRVELKPEIDVDLKKLERHFYTTSSCGVCGKASIDAISTLIEPVTQGPEFTVSDEVMMSLPEKLRARQSTFEHTGGLHASALFDARGELILIREDVGRHNALDKLIGAAFSSDQLPLDHHILLLSGRTSFELIQKATMAGIKIVAAIGAPSSLAVDTAKKFSITLIGFLRGERFNIYSEDQRIKSFRQPSSSLMKELREVI